MHLVKPWLALMQTWAIMTTESTGPQYVHLFSYSTCTAPLSDLSISQYANYKFYCNSLIQTWVTAVQDCVSNEHVNIYLHALGAHIGDWYHVKLNVTIPSDCDGWMESEINNLQIWSTDMNIAPRVLRQTIQYQSGASLTMGIEAQGRAGIQSFLLGLLNECSLHWILNRPEWTWEGQSREAGWWLKLKTWGW